MIVFAFVSDDNSLNLKNSKNFTFNLDFNQKKCFSTPKAEIFKSGNL